MASVTIDQLRTFIAAVDEGSFSAAGRKLNRAQSVVSQTLAGLESQIGVQLFDRSGRIPVLTDRGKALIVDARAVVGSLDLFKARAKSYENGLEPELSVAVDVMFPMDDLTSAVADFQREFPKTSLRLYVEALGAVLQPVLDGRCAFGIMGSLPTAPDELTRERLLGVPMEMVVSPGHPLAAYGAPIPRSILAQHLQLVLTDRSDLSSGREFGVFSQNVWRLADLGSKAAFLRAGLGWGAMPRSAIEADLKNSALVRLVLEDALQGYTLSLSTIYLTATPPGQAGRWLIERLKRRSGEEAAELPATP